MTIKYKTARKHGCKDVTLMHQRCSQRPLGAIGRLLHMLVFLFCMLLSVEGVLADDDTLRDLGTNAVLGEIPKWNGSAWQLGHDNEGVTIVPTNGVAATNSGGIVTIGLEYVGRGSSNGVPRFDEVDMTRPPIGSVVGWLKSYVGTPTNLPSTWVECDGQILSDPESPYNGQTIPNLNGASAQTKRFLRGSTSSGNTGGTENHSHSVSYAGGGNTGGDGGSVGPVGDQPNTTGGASTLPSYYEVVWIVRVK